MEEDHGWEEAALNSRHIHNRNDRGGRGNTREPFQIRNTLGTHLVKCPALERLHVSQPGASIVTAADKGKKKASRSNSGSGEVVLDIYRLTDGEDGIVGSLNFPAVFGATVVFAGSRKSLTNITRHLGQDLTAEETYTGKARGNSDQPPVKSVDPQDGSSMDEGEEEASEDEQGLSSQDTRQRRRVATFEKNSFRQPKFWFRWQGDVSDDALANLHDLEPQGGKVHGSGYLVFSGNDCRRFQGTMTCDKLGWNNVKMTGFKAKPQPERDFEIQWSHES